MQCDAAIHTHTHTAAVLHTHALCVYTHTYVCCVAVLHTHTHTPSVMHYDRLLIDMVSADYFVTVSRVTCHVSCVGGDTLVTLLVIVLSR